MSMSDVAALRGGNAAIPQPRRRWATRVLVPAMLLLLAGGVLAYAGRESFRPATDVRVAPAVPIGAEATGGEASAVSRPAAAPVQAAGWIEPDPYAVNVPALAEGVVREVLVLEGDAVEAGQVIVRMIDDDARLAHARAEAEVKSAEAEAAQADADVKVSEARTAETRRDVDRRRPLVETGAIPRADVEQAELKLARELRETESAQARAALRRAQTEIARAARDEARLRLDRMELRSPSSGIVLQRLVQPGSRLTVSGQDAGDMPTVALRLYQPEHLRVRVDVPLADSGKVSVGTLAEVTTEAVPGKVMHGEVTRVIHEANIQRNTVQVKVRLADGDAGLKPEMLTRVKLLPQGNGSAVASGGGVVGTGVVVPKLAVSLTDEQHGTAWVVDQAPRGALAARRSLTVAGADSDGNVIVTDGLRPGDRVIVDAPATLVAGTRVRIIGEAEQ